MSGRIPLIVPLTRCCGVVRLRRFLSKAVADTGLETELSSLISNLTDEGVRNQAPKEKPADPKSTTLRSIQHAASIESLKQLCGQLERPLTPETTASLLGRFSSLSFENRNVPATADWLKSNLLTEASSSLVREDVKAEDALVSLTSLISLGLSEGALYNDLLSSLKSSLSSHLSTVPVSLLIRLAAALRTHNVRLPHETQELFDECIKLKTSEVETTGDAISLLINVDLSETLLETVLDKVKTLLPLMSTGELVSLAANLATRGRRRLDILPLIAAAFQANPNSLTVNQLCTLAQSMAKLEFSDARLLRRVVDDTVANAGAFRKCASVSTLTASFAKLRLGHPRAWRALTNWITQNHKKAAINDVSFVVSSCAIADVGGWIEETARHLACSLDVKKASSAVVWLNTVHALAICNALTAPLAETVLREEFVEQFAKLDDLPRKVFALSRIAQVQAVVDTQFADSYKGPRMELSRILPPGQELNNAALLVKCGRKAAYDAEVFHSMLYKMAPLGTHATGPSLNQDGFFVDALVQLDSAKRFVPVKNFAHSNRPTIAVVYLGRKQTTLTCEEDEERRMLGPVALGVRLLKARGFVPVTFTELELQANRLLTQKLELVRRKLHSAVS